ncbi:MAG TPA: methyltransferase domain-containing protein, partial [Nocardioidaceae bacterium]
AHVSTQEPSIHADDDGLRFRSEGGRVLDVLFDGRRVWSLDVDDHRPGGDGWRTAAWPEPIKVRLDGRAHVVLQEHVSGEPLGEVEASFGSGRGRAEIVDDAGRAVAVTKWGRLNQTFATTDREAIEGYLDDVQAVLDVLSEECGVPAFLSFGSLLGAVREGKLIGHDVDVDLGYFSSATHPVDVMRESFRIERTLRAKGWAVTRENGGFLALFFPQKDGTTRNLDVFTAFCSDGRLYQVHDVATDADESAVLPLSTVDFEGRRMPAPAVPEVFLEAAYGPDWRIPNPAFQFATPKADMRRVNGWFGGLRGRRDFWRPFYGKNVGRIPTEPSTFARWVAEQETPGRLLDVGCGTARDTIFFAEQGFDVTGFDIVPRWGTRGVRKAGVAERPAIRQLNLDSWRESLAAGARLAHEPGTRVVYGRFLLHALTDVGRDNFWRLTSMALRAGGRCYVEFRTDRDEGLRKAFGEHYRRFLSPDAVVAEAAAHGARTIHREAGRGLSPFEDEDPHLCRMILEWSR